MKWMVSGGIVGTCQCLDMGMKMSLISQPAGLCLGHALLRALLVLTWGSLCHLQAGAEGREGEGCGTVGLLLEHSFEIGESSNLLAWTLNPAPSEVGNSGLGAVQF